MKELELFIRPDGRIVFIHSDEGYEFAADLGEPHIQRASVVEPTASGQWTADMSPSDTACILGPFPKRQEALNAETTWLSEHLPELL